ncbi:O-antigen ligase family protein [Sphingomonas sp. GM_Shp_2]|uniref:O-antigen ligase family protein n=1 Tax=Sphingomonas sp. GM_Shp_2 TaxID=2937380 RepID=UPI00226A70A3|nr:O-antigen ligase family protein [Sphingomonas sp. GM_Shp_2]
MIRQGTFPRRAAARRPGLSLPDGLGMTLVISVLFLIVLWVAGGASRPDVMGQPVVRGAAWMALCLAALFAPRPALVGHRSIALFLGLALALALVQLVPLPPSTWQMLPGRALLTDAAAIAGGGQPWRPLSMVPDATTNAAASLVVPIAMLVLLASMQEAERRWLPVVLLGLIVASTLLGLLQFSGSRFNNPLINDTVGQISASFANRNHLALFLAIGCVLAPAWAVHGARGVQWRLMAALGMTLLFVLMILATGSRAGLLLCSLALAAASVLVWKDVRRELRRYPRWVLPALGASVAGVITVSVLVAVAANRAMSINRILVGGEVQDMRGRALPTVVEMVRTYFPAGSGLGGFDPIFRIHEPQNLLKLTYFNHAHNDLLEVALDTGLPGLLLLFAAIAWWGIATFHAWRGGSAALLPRLGSVILGLILVASLFDYPVRTPMIMAVLVIAAWWLNDPAPRGGATLRN